MNKVYLFSIILCFFAIIQSCVENAKNKADEESAHQDSTRFSKLISLQDSIDTGIHLFQTNCAACHSIRKLGIGPPMSKYWKSGGVSVHYSSKIKLHNTLKIDSMQLKFIDAFINRNVVNIDP